MLEQISSETEEKQPPTNLSREQPRTPLSEEEVHVPMPLSPYTDLELGTLSSTNSRKTIAFMPAQDRGALVEDFFSGTVEQINQDSISIVTTSSGGEEASATIPLLRVPESERPYLEVGAPIRVAILCRGNRRSWRIRLLRPAQWRPDERQRELVASWLYDQAKAMLRET
jgi:hypothetical protein